MMCCATFSRAPETVNAPPIAASPVHVKVPVTVGLAFGAFKFNLLNIEKKIFETH